jgi:magnesium chelatase family protein
VHGVCLVGARAEPVVVEARFAATDKEGAGLDVILSGLPDPVLRESKGRVLCALDAARLGLPRGRLVLHLSPAGMRKRGEHLDLALALAAATAAGHLDPSWVEGRLFIGELGIDGRLVDVPGGLAAADTARALGLHTLIGPPRTALEASHLPGVRAIGAQNLAGVLDAMLRPDDHPAERPQTEPLAPRRAAELLAAVGGQDVGKHALEVAAAGGHGLLFVGPPGTGKTLLARALAELMPPLSPNERIELTRLVSAFGEWPGGLVALRPFRAPHHTISQVGLIGGGNPPVAGEITRAHLGLLFLDELAEFRRETLEALRQPLEAGSVLVSRAGAAAELPARFQLVAATNPCPCGQLGSPTRACRDSVSAVRRYRERLSGPVLDRIELRVELTPPSVDSVAGRDSSDLGPLERERVRVRRVDAAREFMYARQGDVPNATLSIDDLDRVAPLTRTSLDLVRRAAAANSLSARAVQSLRRVARTVADLEGRADVRPSDVATALALRGADP